MFNLPITLSNTNNLYSTHLSHLFFKYYNEDLNQTLEELKTNVLTPETEDIYNMILNIINKYIFIDDKEILKDILKEEFKTTILKRTDNKNSIHEVSINKILTDNEYLILPGFNTGSFPTTYKNEDYLSDNEKKELGNVSLTKDLNEQAKEEAICSGNEDLFDYLMLHGFPLTGSVYRLKEKAIRRILNFVEK